MIAQARAWIAAHGPLTAGVGLLGYALYEALVVNDGHAALKAVLGALTAWGVHLQADPPSAPPPSIPPAQAA